MFLGLKGIKMSMSHFSVLVVGDDVESQLEPFVEEVDEDSSYAEIILKVKKDEAEEYRKTQLGMDFWKKPEKQDEKEKLLKESIVAFMKEYCGLIQDKNNDWGYLGNPNAKWDWYQIGGRWAGSLLFKEGKKGTKGEPSLLMKDFEYTENSADQGIKKDIDLEKMRKEDIIPTFAILIDGKWYQEGEMGWFGMASNLKDSKEWHKEFDKLLEKVSGNKLLTIVDCHI